MPSITLFWAAPAVLGTYALFLAWRLGVHRRLPLALGPISLDGIPDRAARRHGDKPLFTTDVPCGWGVPALSGRYRDPLSWSASRITTTAGFVAAMLLQRFSLQRGDRVAILKSNHLDMHVLMTAIVRAGGIACPVNSRFAADKLRPYLENIGARILFTDIRTLTRALEGGADISCIEHIIVAGTLDPGDAAAARLEGLLRAAAPASCLHWIETALESITAPAPALERGKDEVFYLVHSSGTTGFPKAVTLRNGPQSHAVRGWLSYVHLSPSRDKGYLAVPNNHQAVILTFNSLLLLGLRVHWTGPCDRSEFDPRRVMRELETGGFTGFFGFPVTYTQLKEIDAETAPLGRMRFWATTADASHEAVEHQFVGRGGAFTSVGIPLRGSVFLDAQGSSEVGTPSVLRYITRFTRRFERRIGRAGSSPFGPRLRIATANGEVLPDGSVGRLEVKGKTVFDGYWNDPALTASAFRDGWFFTGDVARRGRDGHFVQLDREVDVIHTRSGDVYSLLIEEVVHNHPAVFDACVYGERQGDGSQLPAAWIAVRDGYRGDAVALQREINAMLDPSTQLRHIELRAWSEFPMGVTGKTLKRVLSEATEPSPMPERNRPPAGTLLETTGLRGSRAWAGLPLLSTLSRPAEEFMHPFVWLGIVLLVFWAILWLGFKIVSGLVHLIIIVAVALIIWGLVKKGARAVSDRM